MKDISDAQLQENRRIILAAAEIVSKQEHPAKDNADLQLRIAKTSAFLQRLLSQDSLPMKTLSSVKIPAKVLSVDYEASSTRFVVKFVALGQDSDNIETIRTPRTDTEQGRAIKNKILALKNSVDDSSKKNLVVIYKNNEEGAQRKGGVTPSNGYRVMPWFEWISN